MITPRCDKFICFTFDDCRLLTLCIISYRFSYSSGFSVGPSSWDPGFAIKIVVYWNHDDRQYVNHYCFIFHAASVPTYCPGLFTREAVMLTPRRMRTLLYVILCAITTNFVQPVIGPSLGESEPGGRCPSVVAQTTAYHNGSSCVPAIVTNCSPATSVEDLQTTPASPKSTHQAHWKQTSN